MTDVKEFNAPYGEGYCKVDIIEVLMWYPWDR